MLQNISVINSEEVVPYEKEICYFCGRVIEHYRTDLLQMLNKLFLMRKRFVTFAEELLLQNRSVTNAEQVVSHEEEIHHFCRSSDKC